MVWSHSYDPTNETTVKGVLDVHQDVADLIATVLGISSGRGHPVAELTREDGSSLSLATDGEWAALVWTDSLGSSHATVGAGAPTVLVYDYFGSWTEAPVDCQIPLPDAASSMEQFALSGKPATEKVVFQPE